MDMLPERSGVSGFYFLLLNFKGEIVDNGDREGWTPRGGSVPVISHCFRFSLPEL